MEPLRHTSVDMDSDLLLEGLPSLGSHDWGLDPAPDAAHIFSGLLDDPMQGTGEHAQRLAGPGAPVNPGLLERGVAEPRPQPPDRAAALAGLAPPPANALRVPMAASQPPPALLFQAEAQIRSVSPGPHPPAPRSAKLEAVLPYPGRGRGLGHAPARRPRRPRRSRPPAGQRVTLTLPPLPHFLSLQ
jgi:hypothetical protein